MHEHSFIQAILSNIKNKEEIKSIVIEAGELSGIEPKHLEEHLKEQVNWEIKIISKNSKVKCSCGYKGKPKIRQRLHDLVIFECPKCGLIPEVLEGKDIRIGKVGYK